MIIADTSDRRVMDNRPEVDPKIELRYAGIPTPDSFSVVVIETHSNGRCLSYNLYLPSNAERLTVGRLQVDFKKISSHSCFVDYTLL